MKKRVAILISGSGTTMATLVKDMVGEHPAEPVLVVSNNPEAGGLTKAANLGVPTVVVDHRPFKGNREAFESGLHKALLAAQPDIICFAGFMRILTPSFIEKWEGKMLNIHPAILPLFKGLNTHQRALDAGMSVHGCTVHLATPELDGGPILGQAVIPVEPNDTPETLAARLLPMGHRLYPAVLRNFAAGNTSKVSLFP